MSAATNVEVVQSTSFLDKLKTYRPEHGRAVRLSVFWSLTTLWLYGCYRLNETLGDIRYSWAQWLRSSLVQELPLLESPLKWSTVVAAAVFFAGVAGLQILLNKPKIAETLIETQDELKKVTWPTNKETINASTVVLVTVVTLFVMLGVYDAVIGKVFDFIFFSQM